MNSGNSGIAMNPLGASGQEQSYGGWGDGSHLRQAEDAGVVHAEPDGRNADVDGDRDGDGSNGDNDAPDPVDAMLTPSQKKTYGRRILYTSLALLSSPFTALLALVPANMNSLQEFYEQDSKSPIIVFWVSVVVFQFSSVILVNKVIHVWMLEFLATQLGKKCILVRFTKEGHKKWKGTRSEQAMSFVAFCGALYLLIDGNGPGAFTFAIQILYNARSAWDGLCERPPCELTEEMTGRDVHIISEDIMKAAVLDLAADEDRSKFTTENVAEKCIQYNADGIPARDRTFKFQGCCKMSWTYPIFQRIESFDPCKQKGYRWWTDADAHCCHDEGCCGRPPKLWGMTLLDQGVKRYVCDNASLMQAIMWQLMNGQYVLYFVFWVTWLTAQAAKWAESWGQAVGVSGLGNLTEHALDS